MKIAAKIAVTVLLVGVCSPGSAAPARGSGDSNADGRTSQAAKKDPGRFTPTDAEWTALAFEPAKEQEFRAEHITEGKIAVNEDSSTPVFSPYAGRVAKLLVKPSDTVERGQPLFVIEATDTVQALNDFITALSTLNSARSKLNLAQINEKRQNDLYAGKAVPLKDWQAAQDALVYLDVPLGNGWIWVRR